MSLIEGENDFETSFLSTSSRATSPAPSTSAATDFQDEDDYSDGYFESVNHLSSVADSTSSEQGAHPLSRRSSIETVTNLTYQEGASNAEQGASELPKQPSNQTVTQHLQVQTLASELRTYQRELDNQSQEVADQYAAVSNQIQSFALSSFTSSSIVGDKEISKTAATVSRDTFGKTLMPTLYDCPYGELASKIIPDDAFVDVNGNAIKISTIIRILETERDVDEKIHYGADREEGERKEAEKQIVGGRWSKWPTIFKEGQEKEIAAALNAIAQEIHVRCKVPLTRKYMADYSTAKPEGGRNRKPDLVVVPLSERTTDTATESESGKFKKSEKHSKDKTATESESNENGDTSDPVSKNVNKWRTFIAFGEVKSYSSVSKRDIVSGLGDYIYDVLAVQDDRNWVIGCAFIEADLLVYLYDRSGVVRTEKINIHERKEEFLRVAIGVLFVDDKYLGRDPTIKTIDGKRYITVKQSDDTHTELEIVKTIFRSKSFLGRGTTVWYVDGHLKHEKDKEGSTRRGYIVKDSWVDMSNMTKEYVILEKLRGFRNTPYMCTHEDMGERTDYFRQGGSAVDENADIASREHHRVVLGTVGQPITDFKSSKELVLSFMNIFLAITDLRIVKNVLHRDISVNNLLLIDMGNGKRDGCLIDFDYSVDLSDENTRGSLTKRSGTVPFMAIEVLRNKEDFVHDYYHDIESAFYVLIWICLERSLGRFKKRGTKDASKNKAQDDTILKDWDPTIINQRVLRSVAKDKAGCISTQYMFKEDVLDLLAPEFDDIKDYLENLRNFISKPGIGVFSKQRDPMVDREEIRKIHEEAFFKVAAKGTEQRIDDSAVEDTADLASESQQISDKTKERPRHINATPSTGQDNSASDEYSSSDSRPISTSDVSEGGSSSEQTSLRTSEGSVVSVPETKLKRKQRPSGGPGNFVSLESKKQKGSHEI